MIRPLPDAAGVMQLELLSSVPGLRHGFATRRGRLEDVAPSPIARLRQVHGADVLELPAGAADRAPFYQEVIEDRPAADALFTRQEETTVAVAVADCIPVLIADPANRAVAAAHAGWRGLAAGVIENTVAAMTERCGTDPANLVVGIGPAIGPCCFEVGPEVIEAFVARGYADEVMVAEVPGTRPHANLGAVADAVIRGLGVRAENIADAAVCTKCNSEWLWSYRADGDDAGRMICGIAFEA